MSSNRRISRRAFVQTATVPIVAAAAGASPRKKRSSMHVVVVGAGAFGGWTALHLLRGGARVTLVSARPLAETEGSLIPTRYHQ